MEPALIPSPAAQQLVQAEDSSKIALVSFKSLMVAALLLPRDALVVNVLWVKSFVLKSSTAHLTPSDALTTPALFLQASATVHPALVLLLFNAGTVSVLTINLSAQQDPHAQIVSQSNAMTVPALTFFPTVQLTSLALLTSQFDATLATAGKTRMTAQLFLLALLLCQFFAKMAHAENPSNTAKVLPVLLFLKEKFAAQMVHSRLHSHSAQLV
jgi:hypothetical protein